MKKSIVLILVLSLFGFACSTAKLTKTGDTEKKYVSDFLSYMDHKDKPQYKNMMDCISPSYIKKNTINISNYKVNNYSIWGYSVDSYSQYDGMVVAKIWGEDKKWIHELTFKLVKEKGKLYLLPSKHSEDYIDPWFLVKTYINE
ncbi:MAG: hypothetical protein WCQ95_03525 [Bacteroidota bacterium]